MRGCLPVAMDAVASERILSGAVSGRLGNFGTVAILESGPTGLAVTVVRHAGTGLSNSASHVDFQSAHCYLHLLEWLC